MITNQNLLFNKPIAQFYVALAFLHDVVSSPNNLNVHQDAPTSLEGHGSFK